MCFFAIHFDLVKLSQSFKVSPLSVYNGSRWPPLFLFRKEAVLVLIFLVTQNTSSVQFLSRICDTSHSRPADLACI